MNYRKGTDALFRHLTSDDLAKELGCSRSAILQGRLIDGLGKRSAPPNWQAAVARLAEKQAKHFSALAEHLSSAALEKVK